MLKWFDETGIEFVRGIPAMRADDEGLDGKSLFDPQPRGTALDHFIVQGSEILAQGQKEGGFFVMIGHKPESPATSELH